MTIIIEEWRSFVRRLQRREYGLQRREYGVCVMVVVVMLKLMTKIDNYQYQSSCISVDTVNMYIHYSKQIFVSQIQGIPGAIGASKTKNGTALSTPSSIVHPTHSHCCGCHSIPLIITKPASRRDLPETSAPIHHEGNMDSIFRLNWNFIQSTTRIVVP